MPRKTKEQIREELEKRSQELAAAFCGDYQTRLIKILAKVATSPNISLFLEFKEDSIKISSRESYKVYTIFDELPVVLKYNVDNINYIEEIRDVIIRIETEIYQYDLEKQLELERYQKLQNAKAKLTEEELQLLTENIKSKY